MKSSATFAYHSLWSPFFPPSDAPSWSHGLFSSSFHYLKGEREIKKPATISLLHNYFSGCQKIRTNHNQKKKKCYCLIGFWSGSTTSSFKRGWKTWFLLLLLSKDSFICVFFFLTYFTSQSDWLHGATSRKIKHVGGSEESTFTTKNIHHEGVV